MSRASGAGAWGMASSAGSSRRCTGASGQQALVATVGLALFLQEFLRLTQGNRADTG